MILPSKAAVQTKVRTVRHEIGNTLVGKQVTNPYPYHEREEGK